MPVCDVLSVLWSPLVTATVMIWLMMMMMTMDMVADDYDDYGRW